MLVFPRGFMGSGAAAGTRSLLLHYDVSPYVDSSPVPKTITDQSNGSRDTTVFKFGGASAKSLGGGIRALASADFDFGTGDFTIASFLRVDSVDSGGLVAIASFGGGLYYAAGTGRFQFGYKQGGTIALYMGSSSPAIQGTVSSIEGNGNFYHCALTRSAGQVRLFWEGNQMGATLSSSAQFGTSGDNVYFGTSGTSNASGEVPWVGYLDETIVVKGAALWTANFTPPTSAYT